MAIEVTSALSTACVPQDGGTLLIFAAQAGNFALALALVALGANVNHATNVRTVGETSRPEVGERNRFTRPQIFFFLITGWTDRFNDSCSEWSFGNRARSRRAGGECGSGGKSKRAVFTYVIVVINIILGVLATTCMRTKLRSCRS